MRFSRDARQSAASHTLAFSALQIAIVLMLAAAGLSGAVSDYPIVFVSRQIPASGTIYYSAAKGMPGVGPFSRFQPAGPAKLLVRETNGQLRTLIDGSNPTASSMNLIDVNAPDVSYDGSKIVFAGLPKGAYSSAPLDDPGAWRVYVINVDGSGLRQATFSDLNLDYSQFGQTAGHRFQTGYDDTDPVWLPDGRIVFSSTRWPSIGQYSSASTTNLFVMNSDGTSLNRITSERSGADRPLVDPLTGRIVYSRWWRNHRYPTYNDTVVTVDPEGGFIAKNGLTTFRGPQMNGEPSFQGIEDRNFWPLGIINPDGTGLEMFSGASPSGCNKTCVDELNHGYGGGFAPNGDLYANFFPMRNMTEAAGFGGIRRYQRGANIYTPIIGITKRTDGPEDYVDPTGPSYGVLKGNYAGETEVLPDGRLLISWAANINQDYGLYVINSDGSNRTLVHDDPGTTELRARLIKPRALPPIVRDVITQVASSLPPLASGPYDKDGTFVFAALNVYANAPVDWDIASAIPIGTAAKIRFFIDHQRTSWGSLPNLDWPILLSERAVAPDGSVRENAPANVPLFEQIRSMDATKPIPFFGPPYDEGALYSQPGAAHVAGMNFGRPGAVARCVGCHTGHTMIPVPANDADAQWTNLAPGAKVAASSGDGTLLIDRKAAKGSPWTASNATNQWAHLTFPVPIKVRVVRLWNPQSGMTVNSARVRLFLDSAATQQVGDNTSGTLSIDGTNVAFGDVVAQAVRVDITSVTGATAALAEIEVIASGNTDATPPSALAILSLSPNQGNIGTVITIAGKGFGNTLGMRNVTFNGTTASVSTWNDSSITAVVPNGARSGSVVVTVNENRSNGVTFKVNGRLPAPKNVVQKN